MKTKKIRSALPVYGVAAVFLLYGLIYPLYTPTRLLVALALSAAAYLILSKVFPGRVVKVESEARTGDKQIDRMVEEGRAALQQLEQLREVLPGEQARREVDRMVASGRRIFETILQKPDKAAQVRKFMNYYLPTAVKLLTHYRTISEMGGQGEHAGASRESVERSLSMIASAFEKQLDNLYRSEALDISSDVDVLETMLAQEGLLDGQPQILNKKRS